MENLVFKSDEELLRMVKVLSDNHEKVKQEIFILHEVLTQVETDYLEVITELKNRGSNGVQ